MCIYVFSSRCKPCNFRNHVDDMAKHFKTAHGSESRITYAMMVNWNEGDHAVQRQQASAHQ